MARTIGARGTTFTGSWGTPVVPKYRLPITPKNYEIPKEDTTGIGTYDPNIAYPQHDVITKDLTNTLKSSLGDNKDLTNTLKSSLGDNTVVETVTPEVIPAVNTGAGGGGFPDFSVDLDGIWETAGMMADNEIDPQIRAIDRLLQDAGYTADESRRAINEAYPIARRSIQKSIYENFIAGEGRLAGMGTGRGGGRQELLGRAGEREAVGMEGIETAKTRELGAIGRALDKYKGQMGAERVGIEGSRGNLQNAYAEQIRGNRFNEANMRYGAAVDRWGANQAFASPSAATVGGATGTLLGASPTSSGTPYVFTPEEIDMVINRNLPLRKNDAWKGVKTGERYNMGMYG